MLGRQRRGRRFNWLSLLAPLCALALLTLPPGTESRGRAAPLLAAPTASDSPHPTVRLWATRQGMVGGRTANGHVIKERDRFVALPSRTVLSSLGGQEFQVRLSYGGREATAPVWDVGPWNTRDNFWDEPARRESYSDLPRFVPQAFAAWNDGYNGGRDQFGRWVSMPASIDIADGTFWDDLKMVHSDWVDVTFLWLNAPSPPLRESYPKITALKPLPAGEAAAPRPAESAPSSQGAPAAPTPVPTPEPTPTPAPTPTPTPPPAGQRWYVAEANTSASFETFLLVHNPHAEEARVSVAALANGEIGPTTDLTVSGGARKTVQLSHLLPAAEAALQVDADRSVIVERSTFFRQDAIGSMGATDLAHNWCIAAGSTVDGADTWLVLVNPHASAATATLTVYPDEAGTPLQHQFELPPRARYGLRAADVVGEARFGACVEASLPVTLERSTYERGGGHGGLAASELSATWYFAEGNSRSGLRTLIAIANPHEEAVKVDAVYHVEGASAQREHIEVPGQSQVLVDPARLVPGVRFATSLTATAPIVVERVTYFGPGGQGSHGGIGATRPATTWHFAEGTTADLAHEYLLLLNPGETTATVQATLMTGAGERVRRTYTVAAGQRATVDVNAVVTSSAVALALTSDVPVIAERSIYWGEMQGGSSSIGIDLGP